jgi:hypothetical protein
MKRLLFSLLALSASLAPASAALLDKQAQLGAQTFWDNRDWDWYKANIPFFECPDIIISPDSTKSGKVTLVWRHCGSLDSQAFRQKPLDEFIHADGQFLSATLDLFSQLLVQCMYGE